MPLLHALAAASIRKISAYMPQDRANMAWSFSTRREAHVPLLTSLAAAARRNIRHFLPQHHSNTAWALATLRFTHCPLLHAIASASLRLRNATLPHALTSLAWAFARLKSLDMPWFDALSESLLRNIREGTRRIADRNIGMALWALSCQPDLSCAWALIDACKAAGRHVDGVGLGGLVAACERRGLYIGELRVLESLPTGSMRPMLANASAMLLAEAGAVGQALIVLRGTAERGSADRLSLRVWLACGGESQGLLVKARSVCDVFEGEPYSKELRLLAHVIAEARPGDARSVCEAMETFGAGLLQGGRQWLKIAGGSKAEVLTAAIQRAPSGGCALEIGTYCGYSAARLARARLEVGHCCWQSPCVVTIEVDALHVAISRNVLAFAGLAHAVDVRTGHSEDTLPWVVDRLGGRVGNPIADFVFLDQRGSRYKEDLSVLERLGALKPGAIIVADNVLKPGAPLFLWYVSRCGAYSTEVISVTEFAMPMVEDWMSLSVLRSITGASGTSAEDPPLLRVLEWKAERMRARANQPDHGGSGVEFVEWAEFSEEMRRALEGFGLSASVPARGSGGEADVVLSLPRR